MKLTGKKVAILATNGFEESELTSPLQALKDAGGTVDIIAPDDEKKGKIRSWKDKDWGSEFDVDRKLDEANPSDYDGLVLPGGVMNPDQLRMNKLAVNFIRGFFEMGKPVAAICHGPQLLIEADVVHGRKLTSYPSLKKDLMNAGAHWVDAEVVVDHGLVTSRKPDDLPAFNQKVVEEIWEGIHHEQAESVKKVSEGASIF